MKQFGQSIDESWTLPQHDRFDLGAVRSVPIEASRSRLDAYA
jgi:hypothetical protein